VKWTGKRGNRASQPARERSRRPNRAAFHVSRFTFYVLRFTFHVSRTCRAGASERRRVQPIITAELHHSCTVSSPIFENAFHYPLCPNHLQNPIRKMVQFLIDIARRTDLSRRSLGGRGSLCGGRPNLVATSRKSAAVLLADGLLAITDH